MSSELKSTNIIDMLKEDEMIKSLLEYVKNGKFPNNHPNAYMNAYTKVQNIADYGDLECKLLFEFYNETIQKSIEDCYKTISKETTSQLIDSFIKQTEKINFLIYWMERIFCFLERFYLRRKGNTLSKIAINLYKDYFFNPLENEIYVEVDKLIDRKSDLNSKSKIKTILKIISDLDLSAPKIVKENDIICWIQEKGKCEKNETKYKDKWSEILSKYETKFE